MCYFDPPGHARSLREIGGLLSHEFKSESPLDPPIATGDDTLRRLILLLLLAPPLSALSAEKRCGWLENPTPGNLWLIDRDSDWTLAIQGRGFVNEDAMENLPAINQNEFVRTNGHYGFSCVCLDVETDAKRSEITNVYGGKQLLLKRCLEDPDIYSKIPLR